MQILERPLRGSRLSLLFRNASGKDFVVLGGGSAAFDRARVALRLRVETVNIACLEAMENIPASEDEILQGREEGLRVHPSKIAAKTLRENGRVSGVEFADVISFHFEDDGTVQTETGDGAPSLREADTVVFAIGQQAEIPRFFNIDTEDGGRIEMDTYTGETSREGVFAAGDAATGSGTLIGGGIGKKMCLGCGPLYRR